MPGPVAFDAMRPAMGPLRLVRSLAIALLCTATAAFAHLSAGGIVPGSAMVTLFFGASAIAWIVSARRVTTGQMVGLLVLCQIVVHLTCSMGSMDMTGSMLATHAAATALSALALAHGEAFVWRVAERLGLRLRPHLIGFEPVPARTELVPVTTTRTRHDIRLTYSRALRGPPYGCS